MYQEDTVKTCDWCDIVLVSNPFTRTHNRRLHLFCSVACLDKHYQAYSGLARSQTSFLFDVVGEK